MSDIEVRPALPGEFAAIGELTVLAYATGGHLFDGDGYDAVLRDAAGRATVAELLVAVHADTSDTSDTTGTDGAPLGSVTVVAPGTPLAEVSREGELEFRMLAVAPHAQRRGVGEALATAVVERARAAGARRVVLCSSESMTGAHRLYTRLGFRRCPERDWNPRPEVRLLAFSLDPSGG